MSSICGIVNLNRNSIDPAISASMMHELGIYEADFSDTWTEGQVFMGCYTQLITRESVYEHLPYHDIVT